MSMESPGELLERRQQKMVDLKNSGINLYPNDFCVSHTIAEIRTLIETGEMPRKKTRRNCVRQDA